MKRKFFFPGPEGVKLCGILTDPQPKNFGPVWILAHGSNTNKNSTNIVRLAEILEKKGVATLRIDLYAHGESGGKYEEMTLTIEARAVLAAVRFLKTRGYKRIGLLGSSYGGSAAIIAASKTHSLFALALKSPVADYPDLFNLVLSSKEIADWEKTGRLNDPLRDDPKLWIKYAFFTDAVKNDGYKLARKILIQTLIVHGDKDEDVPLEQSRRLVKSLKNGRLEVVAGADHRYTKLPHTKKMLALFADFMVREARMSLRMI